MSNTFARMNTAMIHILLELDQVYGLDALLGDKEIMSPTECMYEIEISPEIRAEELHRIILQSENRVYNYTYEVVDCDYKKDVTHIVNIKLIGDG